MKMNPSFCRSIPYIADDKSHHSIAVLDGAKPYLSDFFPYLADDNPYIADIFPYLADDKN